MWNMIKETLQYSPHSPDSVSIWSHISAAPLRLCIPAGQFAAMWPPGSPVQGGFPPTRAPASSFSTLISDLLLLSQGNKLTQVTWQAEQLAVNQWQMLKCKMRISEPHPVQTVSLPRAAAGVVDQHGKKQAEKGFAIVAGTKALAAVAIESEGRKGCTHTQTTACTAAVKTCCKNCSLLPQHCSSCVWVCTQEETGFNVIQ